MEVIFTLIGLLVLVTIFLPWINAMRLKFQKMEIEQLYQRLSELERQTGKQPVPTKIAQPMTQEVVEKTSKTEEVVEKEEIAVTPKVKEEEVKEDTFDIEKVKDPFKKKFKYSSERHLTNFSDILSRGFEMNIAAKLPVWIGALSLILGIVFLVKYSIETGLLSPFVRVCLGTIAGSVMVAAGQWISQREYIANFKRISQGLMGAGLVALYASIYAAVGLYGFFPPLFGFVGMSIVSAMAVIFSLRHGQPIAVFGLIGGFLTPALIGGEPNTIALFGYLFIFFAFMFHTMMRKGWWVLCLLSVLAGFGWPVLWIAALFNASEAFIVLLFVIGLTGIVLSATHRIVLEDDRKESKIYPHLINIMAIAGCIFTIFWINHKITLTLFDWSMLGLLSAASITLSYFKPDIYLRPLFYKVSATFVLFALWAGKVSFGVALPVIIGLFALYVIGSGFILRQNVANPRSWALLQTLSAGALYTLSYLFLDMPAMFIAEDTLYGFLALGFAVVAIDQAAKWRKVNHEHMTAIYVLTASAFISTGFVIILPWSYAAMAIAGQVLATAYVYRETSIPVLNPILYTLTVGFALLSADQFILFADLFIHAILDETASNRLIKDLQLSMPVLHLGLPLVCLGGAIHFLSDTGKTLKDRGLIILYTKISLALSLALSYYGVRFAFDPESIHYLTGESSFIARSVMTILCFGVGYGALKYFEKVDLTFLKPMAMLVFAFVAARFIWFDFVIDNPYLDAAQKVGSLPILNGITLTYGAATAFAIWMTMNNFSYKFPKVYIALAAASFLAMVSLHVRYAFNGEDLVEGVMSMEEFYTYSVVWLLSGLVSLGVGIHKNISALRLAATALIGVTICKVFLLDAAELDGLYRVFSFIGLGLSLIGLSFFYTKFVMKQDREAKTS